MYQELHVVEDVVVVVLVVLESVFLSIKDVAFYAANETEAVLILL